MNSTSTSSTSTATSTTTTTTTSIPINVQHYHGITLQAIGLTLVGGLCVSTLSIVAFGLALLSRHTNIAPRCTMRHPNTIWRSRREISNRKKRKKKINVIVDNDGTNHWNGGGGGIGSRGADNNARTTSGDGAEGNATFGSTATTSSGAILISQWKKKLMKWWGNAKAEGEEYDAAAAEVVGNNKSSTFATSGEASIAVATEADLLEMMPCEQLKRPSSMIKSMMKQQPQHLHQQQQQQKQHQHVFKSSSTTFANTTQYHDPTAMTMEGGVGASARRRRGGGVESLDPFTTTAATSVNGNFMSAAVDTTNSLPSTSPSSPITTTTTALHPQDRGNPFLGWIPWTLHLSYDRMLRGIPGTGTRSKGMEGKLLGVNLDAIVLFRYHALCLRVTAVACILCIGIILPMNITACEEGKCNNGLTNYGRTTIANVVSTFSQPSTTNDTSQQQTTKNTGFWNIFWTNQSTLHLLRLYAIAMCTWYITYFTLKNIKREWRENLVLRRVYYLEADHYGNRMAELDRTVYNHPGGVADDETLDDDTSDEEEDKAATPSFPRRKSIEKDDVNHRRRRGKKNKNQEPWIPHPEHRETVPSIELYSVLVGGLPSLPDEVVNSKDMQTALGFSKRASIDWQLAVATTFFDHCVPNQPGFSSSVVAVTILPGAPELAKAWRKWYSAAAALRRLRFIRQVIKEKRYYDIDDVDEECAGAQSLSSSSAFEPTNSDKDMMSPPDFTQNIASSRTKVTFLDDSFPTSPPGYQEGEDNREHQHQTKMTQHLGGMGKRSENSSDVGYLIFRSLNYGPEQQAVYSREMAQGAAACCPNGCCEGRVRKLPIDRLIEMEDATILRLEKAQYELQCAQMKAAISIVDVGEKAVRKPLREDSSGVTDFVLQQRTASRDGHFTEYSSSDSFRANGGGRGDMDVNRFNIQAPTTKYQGSIADDLLVTTTPLSVSARAANNRDREVRGFRRPSLPASVGIQYAGCESKLVYDNLVDKIAVPQSNDIFQPLPAVAVATCNSAINTKPPYLPTSSRSSNVLRMNSEGRFLFDSDVKQDEDDESSKLSKCQSIATLRRRANTAQSAYSEGDISRASNQWNQVNSILRTKDLDDESSSVNNRDIETGVWVNPSFKSFTAAVKSDFLAFLRVVGRWTKGKTDPLTSTLAKDSTYAVITFSSRQASVAARHCLTDGRGVQRWLSVETVPVPPLADSAPCDIITCRGCCRPVTLNINNNQLMLRRYIALASLVFIYVFYTIPITAAQSLVAPQTLQKTLPGLQQWLNHLNLSAEIMSGLVSALLYTSFFALCPVMFKAIANFGSQATSVQEAEKFAMQYYWYFMLVTAFVFTGLADAAINIINHKFDNLEQSIEKLMENIASQTPLTTAATWLNWIIVRTTMTLPLQYLLQVNSFVFGCLGMKCCARCVMGGGPGGPIPYRIYVDGGVVFLCVVALAPQSPLVAPVALLYYVVCVPLWRRNCIFVYRPKFDSGGERWPFLSDMLITSLFMGQFLLTLQMLLRDAVGPAILAAVPSIPTYLYRNFLIKRFRRAYDDAGLLQTSLLDGWDNTIPTSMEKREEFRQFLVDAHKAAYIPVCIAGGATNILTAEPAVVLPSENDDMLGYADVPKSGGDPDIPSPNSYNRELSFYGMSSSESPNPNQQPGAFMRRAMSFSAQHTPRSVASPSNLSDLVDAVTKSGSGSPVSMFPQKLNSREEC